MQKEKLFNDNASTLITMGKIIDDHRCDRRRSIADRRDMY